jgi:hypothetical protein
MELDEFPTISYEIAAPEMFIVEVDRFSCDRDL